MMECKDCEAWVRHKKVSRCPVCSHEGPLEHAGDLCNHCAGRVNARVGVLEEHNPKTGTCRRHAPLPSKSGQGYFPTWPFTPEDSGCYEGIAKLVAERIKDGVDAAKSEAKPPSKSKAKPKKTPKKARKSPSK